MKTSWWSLLLLTLFSLMVSPLTAEDLLGIHGFVRLGTALSSSQSASVKMTQVHVELYTPSGVRLLQTDCAPNGYFFIPVDKPGRYNIKPKGFQGQSFTPNQKSIECGSSECNSGHDVIFEVNGFSINGRIKANEIHGCNPQQNPNLHTIVVKLHSEDGTKLLSVNCRRDGSYTFDGIMPGEYRIFAEHARWKLNGPLEGIAVQLGWDSVMIDSTFTIEGFGLTGAVFWRKMPMKDIRIDLHRLNGAMLENGLSLHDTRMTDSTGSFTFAPVPCGKFTLVPSVELDDGSAYEFEPKAIEINVPLGDLQLAESIAVKSFSVLGSVMHTETKHGVPGVRVKIGDGETITDKNGAYAFHHIEQERIDIEFEADGMIFDLLKNMEVSPLKRIIPAVSPNAYSVCGSVVRNPAEKQTAFSVKLTRPSGAVDIVDTDLKGEYCFLLEPGRYDLSVSSAVVFAPKIRKIHVIDSPLSNIKFIQKKVKLTVSIEKLPDSEWGGMTVHIQSLSEGTMHQIASKDLSVNGDMARASINDLSPGDYQLEILRDGWCWKEQRMDISLAEDDFEAPAFKQTGIEKKLMMTHDAELRFTGLGTDFIKDGLYEKGQIHPLCFSSATRHIVNVDKHVCFTFDKDMVIDPTDSATHVISASGFQTIGTIRLPDGMNRADDITVRIKSKTTGLVQTAIAKYGSTAGLMVYQFKGSLGEQHEITPKHETLLFNPESIEYSHTETTCPDAVRPFNAKYGTFVTGKIDPAVEEVHVRLILRDTSLGEVQTSSSGIFSFGPFYEVDEACTIEVEKAGYEFIAEKSESSVFHVKSVRLVKVEVAVLMKREDKSGVWVALAGTRHSHRKNGQTDKNGVVTFWKLAADSYYIKPLFKEHEFDPPFQQVQVDGTRDEHIEFTAKRTGFSVFGNITGLTGKPVSEVSVFARSGENEESCASDENGGFHLQNLKPMMEYDITVRIIGAVREAWPRSHKISIKYDNDSGDYTDTKDVNFVAYKDDGTINVNGVVEVESGQIEETEVQILKTVRSDGGTRLVATLKPYFNGWIETYLNFPGKYTFKVVNKELERDCHLPSLTITLDATSPKEVYVGDLKVDCSVNKGAENVDYATSSYWPVLVTVIAILAVPMRAVLRGMGSSAE